MAIATRRNANDKDSSESVPDTVARRFHNTVRLPDFSNHGLKKSGEIDVIQSSDVELFRTLLFFLHLPAVSLTFRSKRRSSCSNIFALANNMALNFLARKERSDKGFFVFMSDPSYP